MKTSSDPVARLRRSPSAFDSVFWKEPDLDPSGEGQFRVSWRRVGAMCQWVWSHLPRLLRVSALVLQVGGVSDRAMAANAPEGHRIESLEVRPGSIAELRLSGNVIPSLARYFDLFPIERSSDLITWQSVATVFRTNLTNAVTFQVEAPADRAMEFFRTSTEALSTAFFPPTGPFRVGVRLMQMEDAGRSNRFGIPGNRSFMLNIWYPAGSAAGGSPVLYQHPRLTRHATYWSGTTNISTRLRAHAVENAPLSAASGRFPVVIYSHGLGDVYGRAVRTENTRLVEELVSQGYVVVSMDHMEAFGCVLASGEFLAGRRTWSFDLMNERKRDVGLLLDWITAWDAEDEMLKGRLDLDRIGIMGWSFGGGTAAETGTVEPRLKAVALIDAYLANSTSAMKAGVGKPLLSLNSGALIGDNTTVFNKSSKDAYLMSIKGADHERFMDNAWIIAPTAASRRQAEAIGACVLAFFEKHLRGIDDHFLDAPGITRPDVIGFKSK